MKTQNCPIEKIKEKFFKLKKNRITNVGRTVQSTQYLADAEAVLVIIVVVEESAQLLLAHHLLRRHRGGRRRVKGPQQAPVTLGVGETYLKNPLYKFRVI